MRLSDQQFAEYEREGLLLIPGYFSSSEIEVMRREVDALAHEDRASRVLETDKVTVRALHGCHLDSEVFGSLTRLPRLLEPAQRLLGGDVYVHQFKVNMKAAFGGDVWPWHQDYVFWLKEDGMATPRATNIAILADDVTEFNGPMYFIPGSHRAGVIDVPELVADDPGSSDGWVANVSAKLKYTLDRHTVAGLVDRFGMVSPKGPAGSVLFFHPNLAHGSTPNLSPYDRTLIILTYNSVENIPRPAAEPRPAFLVSRDYSPLTPLEDDALLSASSVAARVFD